MPYEINDRIFELRKALNLTQTEFGSGLGVGRGVIANIEYKSTDPKPLLLQQICKTYNVSLEWLQTGEGEMFSPRTEDEELAVLFGEVLSDDCSPERRRIIRAIMALLSEIPDEMLPVIGQHFRTIADACDNKEE